MMVWRAVFLSFLAGIACSCQQGSGDNAPEKNILIRLSHSHRASFSSDLHLTAWLFKHFVEDLSDELEVKIYASNALGQEREIYEAMQLGAGASCAISGAAILNNFIPEMGVLDLPYLWKDYAHIHAALDGDAGRQLTAIAAGKGLKILAYLDSWGYRNVVTASKEIQEADDLQGLKIRTIQAKNYIETINAMGMNATPMAFGEIYTGLQTGILDGFEHAATTIQAGNYYEVADHLTFTRHLFGVVVFAYSAKQWNKLTDVQQEVVTTAVRMATEISRSIAPLKEHQAIEFLKSRGMQVHHIDTEPFYRQCLPLQDRLAAECGGSDILKSIRKYADE